MSFRSPDTNRYERRTKITTNLVSRGYPQNIVHEAFTNITKTTNYNLEYVTKWINKNYPNLKVVRDKSSISKTKSNTDKATKESKISSASPSSTNENDDIDNTPTDNNTNDDTPQSITNSFIAKDHTTSGGTPQSDEVSFNMSFTPQQQSSLTPQQPQVSGASTNNVDELINDITAHSSTNKINLTEPITLQSMNNSASNEFNSNQSTISPSFNLKTNASNRNTFDSRGVSSHSNSINDTKQRGFSHYSRGSLNSRESSHSSHSRGQLHGSHSRYSNVTSLKELLSAAVCDVISQAPTTQPTSTSSIPTTQPTLSPTNNPTASPTNDVTYSPTNNPILSPTNSPTKCDDSGLANDQCTDSGCDQNTPYLDFTLSFSVCKKHPFNGNRYGLWDAIANCLCELGQNGAINYANLSDRRRLERGDNICDLNVVKYGMDSLTEPVSNKCDTNGYRFHFGIQGCGECVVLTRTLNRLSGMSPSEIVDEMSACAHWFAKKADTIGFEDVTDLEYNIQDEIGGKCDVTADTNCCTVLIIFCAVLSCIFVM